MKKNEKEKRKNERKRKKRRKYDGERQETKINLQETTENDDN